MLCVGGLHCAAATMHHKTVDSLEKHGVERDSECRLAGGFSGQSGGRAVVALSIFATAAAAAAAASDQVRLLCGLDMGIQVIGAFRAFISVRPPYLVWIPVYGRSVSWLNTIFIADPLIEWKKAICWRSSR